MRWALAFAPSRARDCPGGNGHCWADDVERDASGCYDARRRLGFGAEGCAAAARSGWRVGAERRTLAPDARRCLACQMRGNGSNVATLSSLGTTDGADLQHRSTWSCSAATLRKLYIEATRGRGGVRFERMRSLLGKEGALPPRTPVVLSYYCKAYQTHNSAPDLCLSPKQSSCGPRLLYLVVLRLR